VSTSPSSSENPSSGDKSTPLTPLDNITITICAITVTPFGISQYHPHPPSGGVVSSTYLHKGRLYTDDKVEPLSELSIPPPSSRTPAPVPTSRCRQDNRGLSASSCAEHVGAAHTQTVCAARNRSMCMGIDYFEFLLFVLDSVRTVQSHSFPICNPFIIICLSLSSNCNSSSL
jgi:hypothetical protein